jgi:hypothetical protein
MNIYYRAGFFLMLPVLAVWAITRRFPIWGLIPVGLFYTLSQEVGYQLITSHPDVFSSNPLLNMVLTAAKQIEKDLMIPVVVFSVAIVLLAWRYMRQQKPARSFWILIGIYLLVISIQIGRDYWNVWVMTNNLEMSSHYPAGELQKLLYNSIAWTLYNYSALLLLIFSGTLFVRRHGFFAILILVGYFLPTILVGLQDENSTTISLVLISGAVLAYRVILSLIVPIWMSRTSSQAGKKARDPDFDCHRAGHLHRDAILSKHGLLPGAIQLPGAKQLHSSRSDHACCPGRFEIHQRHPAGDSHVPEQPAGRRRAGSRAG